MNLIKAIFKWLGAGSPKKPNVTDNTGKTWDEVQYALDNGFKVSNIRWSNKEWLYKKDVQIYRHIVGFGDIIYPVTDWDKWGSGNTWCILPKKL